MRASFTVPRIRVRVRRIRLRSRVRIRILVERAVREMQVPEVCSDAWRYSAVASDMP